MSQFAPVSNATLAGTFSALPLIPTPVHPPAPSDFIPSAAQIEAEIEAAMSQQLSPFLAGWVERYATVGRRNPYLWKWCRQAVHVTTLPCVAPEIREELNDTKTLGVVLDVLMDDVADQGGDDGLLEELLSLFQGQEPDLRRFSSEEQQYAQLAIDVWNEIVQRAQRLPRYDELKNLLRFDYLQLANVMRYSHLLNSKLDLLNLAEHDVYTPHNMHIMVCSTFDVMASPGFDASELGRLREAVWNAQWMGRIGNLATTWQRELGEEDFTSGVYARAVTCGDLSVAQLRSGDRQVIEHAIISGGHEDYYWRKWQEHRKTLRSPLFQMRSFDIHQWAMGFEKLICLHLGSRGRK